MPATPRWLLAIPDAIRQLDALDRDLLTRRDLERLFGVSKVRAVALMTAFGAGRTGHLLTLPRAALLRQLRRHRTRPAFRGEATRRDRVVTAIRQARLTGIRVAVPSEALEARLSGLPAGVSVEPGRIEVRFSGAQDAVGRLFALAQALTHDYEQFEALVDAGPVAVARFLEFFAARIANRRTRAAYGRAVGQFLAWCDARGLALTAVSPLHVAAYIRTHPGSAPTVKQHLAAIRMLGDWLVVSQVLPVNPAAAVRGPTHVVTKGATPVLSPAEARRLLEAIDPGTLAGRRDRALVSVRLYSFARVSAVIGMRRQDYFRQERQGWLRLHEKGGTRHDVPAHHRAAEALDDDLARAGLDAATAALFQSVDPAGRRLTGRTLSRRLVLAMIKRRAAAAGLPPSTCCHTFRATGITAYLSNGGTLEHAQQIAGHASPKTTKLYDRTADTITVDEIERIVI